MNKLRSTTKSALILLIFILGFYSCKKKESNPETIIGKWELQEIHFQDNNKTYPLDSFRNVISASITFNTDSSFVIKDNFGSVQILPLSDNSSSLRELYNTPRNDKARFIIFNSRDELPITSSKFSIKDNIINFETKYVDANVSRLEKFFHQFELKNNSQLEIYRQYSLIYNKNTNKYTDNNLKFIYKRVSF
jgi:hypothetical protein